MQTDISISVFANSAPSVVRDSGICTCSFKLLFYIFYQAEDREEDRGSRSPKAEVCVRERERGEGSVENSEVIEKHGSKENVSLKDQKSYTFSLEVFCKFKLYCIHYQFYQIMFLPYQV